MCISTVKQVASFKQYQAAYAGGQLNIGRVIFGRCGCVVTILGVSIIDDVVVVDGGLFFGIVRLEQAAVHVTKNSKRTIHRIQHLLAVNVSILCILLV